jgi:hypothetical protein
MPLRWQRGLFFSCLIALYGILSVYVLISLAIGQGPGRGEQEVMIGMISGEGARPPVYRQLVPILYHGVSALTPETLEEAATETLVAWRDSLVFTQIVSVRFLPNTLPARYWDEYIFSTAVTYGIIYLFLLGFIWMLYRLASDAMPDVPSAAAIAPALGLISVAAFAHRYAYIYDTAELFFSCACLYLLLRQKWWTYIGCIALATLNKETSVFCIFFFCIWYWNKLPPGQYVRLLLLQSLAYLLVKGGLTLYYQNNPGVYVGDALLPNLRHLFQYDYYALVGLVVTFLMLVKDWQEKPIFLRGALWMLLPNTAAYILTCNPGEYRSFYWSLPVMVLLAAHTLARSADFDQMALFRKKTA